MRAIISVQHARHRARCAWLLHGASSAKGHCSWMQQVSTAFTQQSSLQAYAWWPESVVTGSSLDASQAQEASQDRIAGGLLQGRRHRYGQRDRPTGAPQGHHVAQVLVLEGQQGPLVDASPQVPCHIVCLLKGHLQQTSTKVTREAPSDNLQRHGAKHQPIPIYGSEWAPRTMCRRQDSGQSCEYAFSKCMYSDNRISGHVRLTAPNATCIHTRGGHTTPVQWRGGSCQRLRGPASQSLKHPPAQTLWGGP